MLPGYSRILICPHCGKEKEVLSLKSCNTYHAKYWSDSKMEAPGFPRVSYIQKCPKCGKYYLIGRQKLKTYSDNSYSFELGTLTFEESVEAVGQLMTEGMSEEEELNIRINLIHTYNDKFYRNHEGANLPNEQDKLIFTENVRRTIELLLDEKLITLKAELYREIGEFESCVNILKNAPEVKERESQIRDAILEHCKKSETAVFLLNLK